MIRLIKQLKKYLKNLKIIKKNDKTYFNYQYLKKNINGILILNFYKDSLKQKFCLIKLINT